MFKNFFLLKGGQLSRCLEDGTRTELPLSEISDEAVNGQMESNCSLEIISSPR